MVDARDVTVFGTLILPGDSVEHGVTVKVRCYPAEDPCTREGQLSDGCPATGEVLVATFDDSGEEVPDDLVGSLSFVWVADALEKAGEQDEEDEDADEARREDAYEAAREARKERKREGW